MVEIRNFNAVEKLRKVMAWCDYQNDDFIAMFQTISQLEDCYDACHKHGVEFADNLSWDKNDPDYINSPQYLLAREVNDILGIYKYKIGTLTIPMLTQAKKEFVELLKRLENMDARTAFVEFDGYNRTLTEDGDNMFECKYKSITVTIADEWDGKCTLRPDVEINDDKNFLSFRESFDELLYGHGHGCLAVDGDLFTRVIDIRDVLGLQGNKFDVGSFALWDYLENNPEKAEELKSNGWLPKVFVPDDVFESDYFALVAKVRIVLFLLYEDYVTCEHQEVLDDLYFYTGIKAKSLSDVSDDDLNKFIKGVEDYGIKWKEEVKYRIL